MMDKNLNDCSSKIFFHLSRQLSKAPKELSYREFRTLLSRHKRTEKIKVSGLQSFEKVRTKVVRLVREKNTGSLNL